MQLQYGDFFTNGAGRDPNRRITKTPFRGVVEYETINSFGWDVWCTAAQSDFAKWAKTATYMGKMSAEEVFAAAPPRPRYRPGNPRSNPT